MSRRDLRLEPEVWDLDADDEIDLEDLDDLLDRTPETIDRTAVVDLATGVTSTRGHRSGDSPEAIADRIKVRVYAAALEFEDPRPVLRTYLAAVHYATGLRTGAADPMVDAEEALDAAAVLDASGLVAALARRLDALLGLLTHSAGARSS